MAVEGASDASFEAQMVGTIPVPEKDRLDEARLLPWLEGHVDGFAGPLSITKFKGGQSNPTYRLDTPAQSYVLRRQPFGNLLPSAHAVDREYRVISALHGADFPVPRAFDLCEDSDVIGSKFYVMAMVEGRNLWDGTLPGMTADQRRDIYHAMIDTLADLHAIRPADIGLADFGKPGDYCARQIARWSKQYKLSETEPVAEMDRLIDWLPMKIPPQMGESIAHGDYRLDNMIFHPAEPRVIAVLDWELCTLGDPIADFSYLLMNWINPPDGRAGIAGLDLQALGIPTMAEATARYQARSGIQQMPDMDWYMAFNLFRIAAILQGIKKRVIDGTASSAQAAEMASRVKPLAERGWDYARNAGAV